MKQRKLSTYDLAFIGVMAAIIYVVTLFRIPLGQSKIHLANAMCLLAGLLFGPVSGGLASGIGSALYDALAGGYDLANVIITFVSKFAMAFVCGLLSARAMNRTEKTKRTVFIVIACIVGALTYVALYMLKTWIFQMYVYHVDPSGIWVIMAGKLFPSLLNALAAVIVAPILYPPLYGILKRIRVL